MKIDTSRLDFSSQHSASSTHTLQESLRAWVGNQRPDFEGNNRNASLAASASPAPAISAAARAAQVSEMAGTVDAVKRDADQ